MSDIPDSSIANRQPLAANAILYAIYLGISWTWVIGMFLPVLLIRDYGVWAWVIFAIPNCLGAAAMGWVMRSREQSVTFVQTHVAACRLFSLVTIAFHLFFAVWFLPRLIGPVGWVVAAVLVQMGFTPIGRRRGSLAWAAVTFVASLVIAGALASQGVLKVPESQPFSVADAIGLSLVCLLGFIACPYFDLTFHRARQMTSDSGAKIAFGIGFCGVFASMIVLTLLYASNILTLTKGSVGAILLGTHLSLQMIFTVAMHASVLSDLAERRDEDGDARAELGLAMAGGLAAGIAHLFSATFELANLGENLYRIFMSFYGLIFPAYAVTSMLAGRPRWIATTIAIVLAIGFYWLAFIERHMAWASAGVAAVLIVGAIRRQTVSHRAVGSVSIEPQTPQDS